MAQRIWLIRHGKSSRPFGVVDHQRPLAKRAGADAAIIRGWLGDGPRLYVTSTAKRAWETAQLIAGERRVEHHDRLYHASISEFLDIVEKTLAATDRAAFVAHNPTVTQLVNQLAGHALTDNVPTLGVAVFEREERTAPWRLVDYISPKQLR